MKIYRIGFIDDLGRPQDWEFLIEDEDTKPAIVMTHDLIWLEDKCVFSKHELEEISESGIIPDKYYCRRY